MKTIEQYIFFLALIVTVIMLGLAYANYRRLKFIEFSHLTEFWASLSFMEVTSYVFQHENPQIVALSMMGWCWPLRTMRLLLEDMSGQKLMHRWEYIVLGSGGFVSVALASYSNPFMLFTIPFALSVGVVGGTVLINAYRKSSPEMITALHWMTYMLMGLFLVERLTFPYWRLHPKLTLWGYMGDLILIIGFSSCGLSLYLELMKKRHEVKLNGLLKERNDKLFSQSKYSELGMMSAGIAHEINNPLAVIQARTTQLLRIYRDPTKQQELSEGLQQVLYTSERINRTIQGVREFVHQDERMPDTEIRIKDLVDDVLSFCGQRMKNHGVNLRFYRLEKFTVRGHKIQLEQVILNLLNNAFDAIEFLPDKWIEVSVSETPQMIQIFVKDSGAGIPPEIATRMMEPFYSTKEIGKGTGLGLALARGIVEKHGGSLVYVSDEAHTTFMLELPRFSAQKGWGFLEERNHSLHH